MATKKKQMNIKIDGKTKARLVALAGMDDRSLSAWIRNAINRAWEGEYGAQQPQTEQQPQPAEQVVQ